LFDRVPIEVELLCHILDRCLAAAPANKVGEPLRKMRVVGQKLELLTFHFATRPTEDASYLDFEKNARVSAREIAHATDRAIIPTLTLGPADATQRFFERRLSSIMRALKSPKRPRTVATGRKPGKAYASWSRRFRVRVAIRKPRPISSTTHTLETLLRPGFLMRQRLNPPTLFPDDPSSFLASRNLRGARVSRSSHVGRSACEFRCTAPGV